MVRLPRPALLRLMAVTACMFLAAAAGSLSLGRRSLWLDETVSVAIARLSPSNFLHVASGQEANMGLYYLVLRFWQHLGTGEATVRLPSVICFVGTIPVLYLLIARLLRPHVALLTVALFAVNPFALTYAQQARSYTLVLLLTVAATYAFVRGLEATTRSWWLLYTLLASLAVLAHFYAILIVVSHLSVVLLISKRRVLWRQAIPAAIAPVGLTVVLAAREAAARSTLESGAGVRNVPGNIEGLESVAKLLAEFAGRSAPLLGLFLLLLALGLNVLRRLMTATVAEERLRAVLLGAWFAAPILIVWAASFLKAEFASRYLILSLPPFLAIVSAGLFELRSRVPALGIVSMLTLAFLGAADKAWYRQEPIEDWRGAATALLSRASASDELVFDANFVKYPFEYYRERSALRNQSPQLLYPNEPWTSSYGVSAGLASSPLQLSAHAGHRVWLVLSHQQGDLEGEAFARALYRDHRQMLTMRFTAVTIVLFAAHPTG